MKKNCLHCGEEVKKEGDPKKENMSGY